MKHISKILLAILLLCALTSSAQTPVKDMKSFQAGLTQANNKVQNISSDFVQVKELKLLAEKVKSNGKFYFQKDDKVRIEYKQPFFYLLVMNGTRMLVKDEQGSNKINTRNSKMMRSVNQVMVDCMQGTVFDNPDFDVMAYTDAKGYLLVMKPVTSSMKQLFEEVRISMDKTDYNVKQLTLVENGGDNTIMTFNNIRHNTQLNETLFNVK
ncbi:MAG: outer membrane lipoprotein carrier protein LolA [Chitinophagales bacterium]|nr:outer membrane lipoprotein carrier protein LolA [Chitinophagaceae bacterium]MCB9064198.1 outer membrane lipoprotein carrier protein LolA [Chitinophagales bacterium]